MQNIKHKLFAAERMSEALYANEGGTALMRLECSDAVT